MSGWELLRQIRETDDCLVMLVSGRDSVTRWPPSSKTWLASAHVLTRGTKESTADQAMGVGTAINRSGPARDHHLVLSTLAGAGLFGPLLRRLTA